MRQDYTQIDPVVKQAVEILQKAAANKGGLTGIPTGYTKLDDYTAGWQKSDLVIIAGRRPWVRHLLLCLWQRTSLLIIILLSLSSHWK